MTHGINEHPREHSALSHSLLIPGLLIVRPTPYFYMKNKGQIKINSVYGLVKQMENEESHYSGVIHVFFIHYYWVCFLFLVLMKLISVCVWWDSALE